MLTRSPTRPCARPSKKNALPPHRRRMWCISEKPSAEFVFHMEDVLEVYHRPYNPKRPVVCVDETFKQLIGETREPLPPRPGSVERVDHVYTRNGVASLFLACEPLAGWRHIDVTEHRRRTDWAGFIRSLLDGRYREAEKLVLIMDQLNTHSPASLYEAFPPEEAKRLADRIEIHHTPKHGSWLNIAEIELSALGRQCLSRRIAHQHTLKRQIAAWDHRRNACSARVQGQFTTENARIKRRSLYPSLQISSSTTACYDLIQSSAAARERTPMKDVAVFS
jgi:DDE superfamily endonuclease